MRVDELLKAEFDEGHEREYRRGYLDGMSAALDYAGEGKGIDWLYRFRDFVIDPWAYGDCGKWLRRPCPTTILKLKKAG